MSPLAIKPRPLPRCPVCGAGVEWLTERFNGPPSVEPCGDTVSPEQLRSLRQEALRILAEREGPMRNHPIRVPDSLWEKAKQRADERGETVSEAVRKFLERYVR